MESIDLGSPAYTQLLVVNDLLGLKLIQRAVLSIILQDCKIDNVCMKKNSDIAFLVGVHERSVARAVNVLKHMGYLMVTTTGQHSSRKRYIHITEDLVLDLIRAKKRREK